MIGKSSCIFSRSITSSNRIAIVQHHDVPIKQVNSLETHNSNSINCDIVEKQTVVKISVFDKQKVGMVVSKIKSLRPPEPYKGKGIKEKGQYILRKEGKKK